MGEIIRGGLIKGCTIRDAIITSGDIRGGPKGVLLK